MVSIQLVYIDINLFYYLPGYIIDLQNMFYESLISGKIPKNMKHTMLIPLFRFRNEINCRQKLTVNNN